MIQPQAFLPTAMWDGCVFDGQWRKGDKTMAVIEPATGKQLGQVALADPQLIAQQAAAAAQAQQIWAALPYGERARVMRKAARLAEEHAAEIVEWLARDSGSLQPKADFELATTITALEEADRKSQRLNSSNSCGTR